MESQFSWAGWVPGLGHVRLSQLWAAMGTPQIWHLVPHAGAVPSFPLQSQATAGPSARLESKERCHSGNVPDVLVLVTSYLGIPVVWGGWEWSYHFCLCLGFLLWTGVKAMLTGRLWASSVRMQMKCQQQGPAGGSPSGGVEVMVLISS